MKNVLEQGLIDIALTCENAIGENVEIDVQDILRQANEALRKHRAEQKGFEIESWLVSGEFRGDAKNTDEAIEEAGRILDKNSSGEIFGANLFKGADGKHYKLVVEGQIVEVDSEEAAQIEEDNE